MPSPADKLRALDDIARHPASIVVQDKERHRARARIAAAVPALADHLEALEVCTRAHEEASGALHPACRSTARTRAALDKALGGKP